MSNDFSVFNHNHAIYFDGEVNGESISKAIELSIQIIENDNFNNNYELRINSIGGETSEAFRFIDFLEDKIFPIAEDACCTVNSQAFSAGLDIVMCFPKRFATKRSVFMVHEIGWAQDGEYTQLKNGMKFIDIHTNISMNLFANTRLTRLQWEIKWKNNEYFDAKTALEYGIIHGVL